MTWVVAYIGTAIAFFSLDFIWLGFVAKTFYFSRLAHLLADKVNYAAATGFYLIYFAGIVFFAIAPALKTGNWQTAALHGALFGFFCYATYDMTNQSTLRDWSVAVTVVDIIWGTILTGIAATIGYLAARSLP
ncbi:MAG: DUF2177 family protein [Anderseniella sp.]